MKTNGFTALSAALMLAACGGLSAEERQVAALCIDNATGTKDECACIAREMGEVLDDDDLVRVVELAEGDMGDQMSAMMDMGMDPDAMSQFQRISNAGTRAERECLG